MLKDETVEENGRIIINCDRLGLPVGFGILENPYSILKVCFESEFAGDPNIKYDTVASKIEHWKNELMAINTIRDKASREEKKFIPVYEKYQNTLKQKGLIDFNDMIMLVVELFEKCPEILFRYRRRFKYVLVDEYQDTNYAQYKFCKYIVGDSKNYFVVGDDDQSIYEWRGADIRNILFFEQDYPGCKTIKLVKNYRSTANIIYAANEVFKSVKPKHLVKQIEPVKKKADGSEERGDTITLYTAEDDTDEINFIVFEMNELKTKFCDLKWNDFAVLYRSHEQSKIVKRIFEERKIPYIVYNPYFWQRKEIQDVCSYLHVLKFYLNWRSGNLSGQRLELAGFAVNNHIRRLYYLPPLSFSSIENEVMSHIFDPYKLFTEDRVLESMLNRLDGTKSRDNFLMLIEIFSDIASVSSSSSISLAVEDILTRAGYMDIYTKNINPTAQDRESARCLAALKEEAADFERTRGVGLSLIEQIDSFLDSASIRSSPTEQAGLKSSDDAVNLMSLHAAKGLEFGTVFFIGLEEGIIPMQHFSAEKLSKKEKQKRLDEERRLFYVGITRAKERLYLTCATRRSWYGKQKMFEQSRFLKCIPKELLEKGSFRTRLSDKIKHFVVSFFK